MEGIDDLAVETVRTFNDGSVLGAVCVMLILLLIFREGFYWPKQIKFWQMELEKIEAENTRCHIAHDKTREALLEEVRSGGQTLVLVREQLKAQQIAVENLLRLTTEFSRRGGRG